MRLRDFEPRDQDAVEALIQAGLRERWGSQFDPSCNPDLADIETNYLGRGAIVVVAEEPSAGGIAGAGMLVPESQSVGRLVRMSVDAAHRRRGIGRLLVDELLCRAGRAGLERVVVSTDTPWTSALGLYESRGFAVTGVDDTDTHLEITVTPPRPGQELLDRLRALELPVGDHALFGSGPLLVRGWIDEVGDLDVVARGTAWERAQQLGTLVHLPEWDVTVVEIGDAITVGNRWAIGVVDIDELIDGAELVDGIPCARLDQVVAYKRISDRPKDRKHLEIIEAHVGPVPSHR